MEKEETLSMIFNKMTERHGVINSLADMKFIAENNVLEVHCIDLIEKIKVPNVTKLSKTFHLTRGAISKLVKRLIIGGTIEAYQKPENKKEIYYKLTELGREIYLSHEKQHQNRIDRDSLLFTQLCEAEKDSLLSIFEKIDIHFKNELEKMGIDDYI
jgi:DNA-binding MarR family transcriptional regulator